MTVFALCSTSDYETQDELIAVYASLEDAVQAIRDDAGLVEGDWMKIYEMELGSTSGEDVAMICHPAGLWVIEFRSDGAREVLGTVGYDEESGTEVWEK